jgi:hypothetical protein
MHVLPRLLLIALPALMPAVAIAGDSLRCGSRLVTTGDRDISVRETCGEPYYSERWIERHSERTGPETAVSRDISFEDWFLDHGPERFLVRLRFREGRLHDVARLTQRGRRGPATSCETTALRRTMSAGELVAACGLPARREALGEALHVGQSPAESILPTRRERWVYALPKAQLLEVELRAGQVEQWRSERR